MPEDHFVRKVDAIMDCSAQQDQDTFFKEFCSYSMGGRSPLAVY
ncbi:hypothetical protein HMPREF3203_02531 [Proteus mirabilis]|nr:hypothetical protein HMPREF3203_02531 [Proteus mirabilis]